MTKDSGQHVGHLLGQSYGGMGMLYIQPEFRGKGYSKVISSQLMQKYLDTREDVYMVIQTDNSASLNLSLFFNTKPVPNFQTAWVTSTSKECWKCKCASKTLQQSRKPFWLQCWFFGVIIDRFWAMLRAVELFSSSTNLSVILNDSAYVINVKHLERWWLYLNFIPLVVYIYISFNIFLSSKSSSTIFVCAIIMTPNFTCSLIDCYLFLYFLSRDIDEGVLVNLPQMFLVSCRWAKRGCEYMFVAGYFEMVLFAVDCSMSWAMNQIVTAVDLNLLDVMD